MTISRKAKDLSQKYNIQETGNHDYEYLSQEATDWSLRVSTNKSKAKLRPGQFRLPAPVGLNPTRLKFRVDSSKFSRL
jgi:hypothetical protein